MTYKAIDFSRRLERHRRALLQHYDDEELHQLRVTLRRIRSLLKSNSGADARRLRHELGQLAAVTNQARDWDTFISYAQDKLLPAQFDQLRPALEQRQLTAHHQAVAMLNSQPFHDAVKSLRHYGQDIATPVDQVLTTSADLQRAGQRVVKARRNAFRANDDKQWHKLRIAIKDLRYTLQSLEEDSEQPHRAALISICKELQEDLGRWHDTVVHRQLMRELENDRVTDGIQTGEGLQTLLRLIERDQQDRLLRIRIMLEHRDIAFD